MEHRARLGSMDCLALQTSHYHRASCGSLPLGVRVFPIALLFSCSAFFQSASNLLISIYQAFWLLSSFASSSVHSEGPCGMVGWVIVSALECQPFSFVSV
jgi:hypothetical protein